MNAYIQVSTVTLAIPKHGDCGEKSTKSRETLVIYENFM